MNLLLWLILVSSTLLESANGDARKSARQTRSRSDASEREKLLKALSVLISEVQEEQRVRSDRGRSERGRSDSITIDEYEELRESRFGGHKKRKAKAEEDKDYSDYGDYDYELTDETRDSKQAPALPPIGISTPGLSPLEECETTGFETRSREECKEVTEDQCRPVMVTKYKTVLVNRCKTLIDKTCNITHTEVPKEKCEPKMEQKCHTEYNLIEEKKYKEECYTNVQNICEEHIKVPVEVPYPVKVPYPQPSTPPPYQHSYPTTLYPHSYSLPQSAKPHYQTTFSPYSPTPNTEAPKYAYDPTPTPSTRNKVQGAPLVEFIKRLGRKKRDLFGSPTGPPGFPIEPHPDELKLAFRQLINEAQSHDPTIERGIKEISSELLHQLQDLRNQNQLKLQNIHTLAHHQHHDHHPRHHGHHSITKKKEFHHIPHHPLPSHGHLKHDHHDLIDPHHPYPDLHHPHPDSHHNPLHLQPHPLHPHPDTHLSHPEPHQPLPDPHHPHPGPHHLDPDHHHDHHYPNETIHEPVVTSEELPAPPGCRSIATRTCHIVPYVITNKVPYETCKLVPGVHCHLELKTVAELECTPVVDEECNDFAKQIPYLEDEEECEEVVFDECFTIDEQVPVLLCTRTRLDETTVFLQKGQVFRKEGEIRRKKIGRRRPGQITLNQRRFIEEQRLQQTRLEQQKEGENLQK